MTILPKKKQTSNKEIRPNSSSDHGDAHSSHALQDGAGNNSARSTSYGDNSASLRRPLSHHLPDTDGNLNGPHRKRVAGITPSSSGRQDRSSPHRSLRKNRTVASSRISPGPECEQDPALNSEDEYEQSAKGVEFSDDLERKFEEKLKKIKGYNIKKMKEDGACLFRAVADQVYGDQEMNGAVRKLCMDYMAKNADHFSQFVTEDFNLYIARKRVDTAHGNHVEIQAMAEMFNRPIEVFQYSLEPINTFHNTSPNPDVIPIRVSYHRNVHYNSMVDPFAATIGVGLGLPQFFPGLAEKNLIHDALRDSEQHEIEHAMLKDKLRATDWEATDEQIQEQVARESYLEYVRKEEKVMRENYAASGSRGESTVTRPHKPRSPCNSQLSPHQSGPTKCKSVSPPHLPAAKFFVDYAFASSSEAGPSHRSPRSYEAGSIVNDLTPSMYRLPRWEDEGDIMNHVLALSQQEYLDSLKKPSESSKETSN